MIIRGIIYLQHLVLDIIISICFDFLIFSLVSQREIEAIKDDSISKAFSLCYCFSGMQAASISNVD